MEIERNLIILKEIEKIAKYQQLKLNEFDETSLFVPCEVMISYLNEILKDKDGI